MKIAPICANSISCINPNCCRTHAFYYNSSERAKVYDCIGDYLEELRFYKRKFPKKPNWCYDGDLCGDKECRYDHIYTIDGRNIIRDCCKNEIEDILIPVPQ